MKNNNFLYIHTYIFYVERKERKSELISNFILISPTILLFFILIIYKLYRISLRTLILI